MDAGVSILIYAVIAAVSPLALSATLLVIRSERPRTNGIAFAVGFVLGTTIACILGRLIGDVAADGLSSHETVEDLLTLTLGVALASFGLRVRGRQSQPAAPSSSRVDAIMESLRHVRPAASFSMAGLLGFGGPKRLLLTLLAMAAVSSAGHGYVANLSLVVIYIAVATLLVWLPIGMVVVAGPKAALVLGRCEAWMETHAVQLRIWLSLGFGAALVAVALLRLLT